MSKKQNLLIQEKCKQIASELGMTYDEFKAAFFAIVQEEYDRSDIESYLKENDIECCSKTLDDIYRNFVHYYNTDLSNRENINAAYTKTIQQYTNKFQQKNQASSNRPVH